MLVDYTNLIAMGENCGSCRAGSWRYPELATCSMTTASQRLLVRICFDEGMCAPCSHQPDCADRRWRLSNPETSMMSRAGFVLIAACCLTTRVSAVRADPA